SEWGTPNMVKDGVNPELLLGGRYGNALHVWDLKTRRHVKKLDLGAEQQMVLELRPAHNPRRAYGFVGVVISLKDLSSSIFLWYRDQQTGEWKTKKVIEIPAEPADASALPPVIAPFGAVPPLVTDINLAGRPLPVRLLLGHGRAEAVRRLGPLQPEAHGLGPGGRDREPHAAP